LEIDQESVTIIGQLRDSYILLQSPLHVYWVDQHALAERITFEQMRKQVKDE
jgi:DNA mismatch repair ATPase MutL